MEPEQPSPDTKRESLHEETHLPPPTLWPIGFAIGIVVVLVGLIINPLLISSIGAAIAIVFGILWARDATSELRGEPISRVVFTLEPFGSLTRLTVLHDGFVEGGKYLAAVSNGWPIILASLKSLIETGKALPRYKPAE